MKNDWYQEATDLILSESNWHIMDLAKALGKLKLEMGGQVATDYKGEFFNRLYLMVDCANQGLTTLLTYHIVQTFITTPHEDEQLLDNIPESVIFPDKILMKEAFSNSVWLKHHSMIADLLKEPVNPIKSKTNSERMKIAIQILAESPKSYEWRRKDWYTALMKTKAPCFLGAYNEPLKQDNFNKFWTGYLKPYLDSDKLKQ